tara:strand:- start:6586 stop:7104 length:519 start_codon:yes stop_codon:yes gene_type:complete
MSKMPYQIYLILILTCCISNTSPPKDFEFNQSTIQTFYFIKEVEIDGLKLSEKDWIASFNGDVCTGTRQWAGPFTDVPAMGDDGSKYTKGYHMPGSKPIFKIYDYSTDKLFLANPDTNILFGNSPAQIININKLSVTKDCLGVLGGSARVDSCNVCNGNSSSCDKINSQNQY